MTEHREYDPIQDYWESFWLAIRIKRDRGDNYFVKSPDAVPAEQDGNGGGKPGSAGHGA